MASPTKVFPAAATGSLTYYSVHLDTEVAIVDSATPYDLPGLSIANVPTGTYLFFLSFLTKDKNGWIRPNIKDGSGTVLWPLNATIGTSSWDTNAGSEHFAVSGILTLSSTVTVKVTGEASGALSNCTMGTRHLTLIGLT